MAPPEMFTAQENHNSQFPPNLQPGNYQGSFLAQELQEYDFPDKHSFARNELDRKLTTLSVNGTPVTTYITYHAQSIGDAYYLGIVEQDTLATKREAMANESYPKTLELACKILTFQNQDDNEGNEINWPSNMRMQLLHFKKNS